jgi:putative transposase
VSYLCTLFEVSRTAYYRYRRGESHNSDKKYNRPKHEVRIEFIRNLKRYGSRRIKESLKQKGIKIGRRKVAEIMRKEGLRAIQPPRFIPRTTDSKHGKRVCQNLLLDQPKPARPNAVWTSDITYMPLKGGKWAYLCTWMECTGTPAIFQADRWLAVSRQYAGKYSQRAIGEGTFEAKSQTWYDCTF